MKLKLTIFIVSILLFFPKINYAADPPEDPCTGCPIDGGASLLVGAGIAYGMKKIRDNKKSKKDIKDTI